MKLSDIKTAYRSSDYQCAEVALPDGRKYTIHGDRKRGGSYRRRGYYWDFRVVGPGIAHLATKNERQMDHTYRGFSLNCIRLGAANMTGAKRRLAHLLSL